MLEVAARTRALLFSLRAVPRARLTPCISVHVPPPPARSSQGVPTNDLHACGYVSIGCEPCTKPVLPNQHEREGRWWWEDATSKECGLHSGNVKKADGTSEERKAERDLWPTGEGGEERRKERRGGRASSQKRVHQRAVRCAAHAGAPCVSGSRHETSRGGAMAARAIRCSRHACMHGAFFACSAPAPAPAQHASACGRPLFRLLLTCRCCCRRRGCHEQGPGPRHGLRHPRQGHPAGAVRALVPLLPGEPSACPPDAG